VKLSQESILTKVLAITFVMIWGIAAGWILASGQVGEITQDDGVNVSQKKKIEDGRQRNPFLLPRNIYLLSQEGSPARQKEGATKPDAKPQEMDSLKVKAILISGDIRLAQIGRHIVTMGDTINDEKVLKIRKDRVILGKGDKKRTLLLRQRPVRRAVEKNEQGENP
jgi:hypothetical protein